jgi:Rrf2 family protein
MKLTSASVHAVRALAYLARHPGGRPVSAETIAAAEGLSHGFLLKALKPLAAAGVVRSDRGPSGGYRLARPARSLTLLDVVEVVDGPLRGEAPAVGGGKHARLDARLQRVCEALAETVRGRLRRVSLAELAGRCR